MGTCCRVDAFEKDRYKFCPLLDRGENSCPGLQGGGSSGGSGVMDVRVSGICGIKGAYSILVYSLRLVPSY